MSNLFALLKGALTTVEVSFLAVILGTVLGVLLAIAFQSGNRVLQFLVRCQVSFARGTPLFIQIMVIYFLLPALKIDVPRFHAGVIALGFNSSAYISEMIRGAILTIPSGQIEAARALALPRRLIWLHIRLPQVFALILPPLTVEFAALLKGSALLSVIGVVELTRSAQQIIGYSFAPTSTWLQVGVLYFIMCYVLALTTKYMQRATTAYRPREAF